MRKVHDYQLSHPWKETDRNWIRATYYTGLMGLYRTTQDPAVLEQAIRWAEKHDWAVGNEYYDRYVQLFRTMSASIAKRRESDGLWRSNLDDPDQCPNPETSGTAFFCYAMTWGINNRLLDAETYLGVVLRAWSGLVRHVHPDGKLGFVQPVGASPKPATPEMTHEYAMGLLLLAGEEMVKLVESDLITDEVRQEYEKEHQESIVRDRWSAAPGWPDAVDVVQMSLSDRFSRLKAPKTGRLAVQLTSGDAFCYPLYYTSIPVSSACSAASMWRSTT